MKCLFESMYFSQNRREKIKDIFNQQKRKQFGGGGHRSRYLAHAKRALYHLS